jgi:hypothetical protein
MGRNKNTTAMVRTKAMAANRVKEEVNGEKMVDKAGWG